MCNEILNTIEYKQWRQYIEYTGDNVCKCEFKKILERQKKIEKEEKEILEFEKQSLEYHKKIEKDVEFYKSLEKKSLFQSLKEKFSKKYCGEAKFDFELLNFKRNFKKVKYLFTRKF